MDCILPRCKDGTLELKIRLAQVTLLAGSGQELAVVGNQFHAAQSELPESPAAEYMRRTGTVKFGGAHYAKPRRRVYRNSLQPAFWLELQ